MKSKQSSLISLKNIFFIKNFIIYSGSPRPCPVSLSANTSLRAREDDRRVFSLSKFKVGLSFVFIGLFTCATSAFDQQAVFNNANQRYQEGRYSEAMPLYHSIESKGPAVWHNLGNCYWHVQEFRDAFFAYKRAFKDASFFDQWVLKESIAQSRQLWLNSRETGESPKVWWDMLVSLCTHFEWQIFFLIMWVIGLFCIRRWRYRLFFKISSCMVCVLLLFIACVLRSACLQEMPHGIIIEPTKIFVAPKKEVHAVKEVIPGDEVIIVDSYQDWDKVKVHGVVGWLERSCYKAL